jgi:hypothetical protein
VLPGEQAARAALAAWEQAAGKLAEATVRDPRTLELGASLLRTMLECKRTADQMATRWLELMMGGGR